MLAKYQPIYRQFGKHSPYSCAADAKLLRKFAFRWNTTSSRISAIPDPTTKDFFNLVCY